MRTTPRIVILALPLMAKSGVYRSTHDLVQSAHTLGFDWTALIGLRPTAAGTSIVTSGVREVQVFQHGRAAVSEIRTLILESEEVKSADIVISMISQTDIAMAHVKDRVGKPWVAWVRGMPWPAAGEQTALRTHLIRLIETRALRKADDVWATTPILARQFSSAAASTIVPAGIAGLPRTSFGDNGVSPLVWAGRVDVDKRPELFIEIVRQLGFTGRVHGDGPLASTLRQSSPESIEWSGWIDSRSLWSDASIFVGTSSREAFGRSAVEAASAGLPLVISSEYGAAPLLFTDPALRSLCVIDSDEPVAWVRAIRRLLHEPDLRAAVSNHVRSNSELLTISSSAQQASDRAQHLLDQRLGL